VNKADHASLITLALSWAFFVSYYFFGGTIKNPWFTAFGIAYMWIPGLVALVLARREGLRLQVWSRPNRWWLVAWLLPLALVAAAVVAALPLADFVGLAGVKKALVAAGDPKLTGLPDWALALALFLQVLFAGATINALAALGEELMWRGYLWEHSRDLGFWPASLQIGVIWGVWHAPLVYFLGYNYPQHRFWGVILMVVFTILLTPWMLYLREKGNAIFTAAIFHGTINAAGGLALYAFARPNDLLIGLTGLSGFVVLALANLYLRRLIPPASDQDQTS